MLTETITDAEEATAQPWAEPQQDAPKAEAPAVNGAAVLDEARDFIRRFAVLPSPEALDAVGDVLLHRGGQSAGAGGHDYNCHGWWRGCRRRAKRRAQIGEEASQSGKHQYAERAL